MSGASEHPADWDWQPDARAPLWHRRQPHVVLHKVFNSGYVTRGDAYNCMQVNRQWFDCVHGATKLWHRIVFRFSTPWTWKCKFNFANWSDGMANAIAAKRPMEIVFYNRTATRRHVAAILQRCVHLRRLTVAAVDVDTLRALDSIAAPLTCLQLACRGLDDAAFAHIVASAPMLKLLTELHLVTASIWMCDVTARLIAAEFTQLKVLQIKNLTSVGVRHLCANGAHTRTTLRELILDTCYMLIVLIEDDIAEDILAMTNLEVLGVKRGEVCTDEWAADLQRRYEERHNRRISIVRRWNRVRPFI